MRMGTFLLGGVAGAAAVIYLNRKTKSTLLRAFISSDDSMGNIAGKTKDTFSGKPGSETSAKNFNGSNNFQQVEKIIKEDPNLHQTVNEILQESSTNKTTLQQ
jgi:hypothetical protein